MSGELVSLEIEAITDPGYCVKAAMEHKEQRGVTIEVTGGNVNRDLLEKLVSQMASTIEQLENTKLEGQQKKDNEREEQRRKELKSKLDQEIDTLGLSSRSARCLASIHIKYIGELVQKTERQLSMTKGCGSKSLKEIKETLITNDLSLGMSEPWWKRPDGK